MLWIKDMSIPDPYYVLPLIMGVTMFIQQKLSPAPPDPVQAKVMMALPVVFTFMFFWFPAGLLLYWVVNNMPVSYTHLDVYKRQEQDNAVLFASLERHWRRFAQLCAPC